MYGAVLVSTGWKGGFQSKVLLVLTHDEVWPWGWGLLASGSRVYTNTSEVTVMKCSVCVTVSRPEKSVLCCMEGISCP